MRQMPRSFLLDLRAVEPKHQIVWTCLQIGGGAVGIYASPSEVHRENTQQICNISSMGEISSILLQHFASAIVRCRFSAHTIYTYIVFTPCDHTLTGEKESSVSFLYLSACVRSCNLVSRPYMNLHTYKTWWSCSSAPLCRNATLQCLSLLGFKIL